MSKLGAKIARRAAAAWALLTLVLLLLPGSAFSARPRFSPAFEKLLAWSVHLVLFLILAWLVRRAGGREGFDRAVSGWIGMIALLAYCVVLETAQIWVPNRTFEVLDIVVGWLGILGIFHWTWRGSWRRAWAEGRAETRQ